MAKKKTSSKRKVMRFSIQTYDNTHYKQTEAYTQAVSALFDAATQAITAAAAKGTYDPNKPFAWNDYPSVKAVMEKTTKQLASRMTTVIDTGSRKQWLFANEKNNGFIESIMDTSKLSKARLKKVQDRNLDGLAAFQKRKVDGMNLSQRVWKYVGQYKEQIEQALDVGLGEGRSAQQLARDVKQNLQEPNRLFRRVRDKHGNLQLSKAAKAYHPGRGVYRSSVKNAQRLTRSEINMAYRQSDWERWQTLDFVVGFEIKRSNHDPLCECELCDKLKGRYPKEFKFVGWHPQCMCYAIPVLSDEEEFDENELGDLKAALNGTTYEHKASRNTVIDVPKGFTEWVGKNIAKQDDWATTPYFIRDNFKNGKLSEGLAFSPVKVEEVVAQIEIHHVPMSEMPVADVKAEYTRWNVLNERLEEMRYVLRDYGISDERATDLVNNVLYGTREEAEYWRFDEAKAEIDRLEAEVRAAIAADKAKVDAMVAKLRANADAASAWVDVSGWRDMANNTLDMLAEELKDKFPRLISYVNSTMLQHDFTADVDAMRAKYGKAINDAALAIANAQAGTNTSELQRLIALTPSPNYPAWKIVDEINAAIKNMTNDLSLVAGDLKARGIQYRAVKEHAEPKTPAEIVKYIGGGDLTKGSCASVGLAYAANRAGLDVLDFRGGKSWAYFASWSSLKEIAKVVGGESFDRITGMEMMQKTEVGKEYYLVAAHHASIVRQVSPGKYEYLELQSAYDNGWHPLNDAIFAWRFEQTVPSIGLYVDIEKLGNDPGFREMMGYINTVKSRQRKGIRGTIK